MSWIQQNNTQRGGESSLEEGGNEEEEEEEEEEEDDEEEELELEEESRVRHEETHQKLDTLLGMITSLSQQVTDLKQHPSNLSKCMTEQHVQMQSLQSEVRVLRNEAQGIRRKLKVFHTPPPSPPPQLPSVPQAMSETSTTVNTASLPPPSSIHPSTTKKRKKKQQQPKSTATHTSDIAGSDCIDIKKEKGDGGGTNTGTKTASKFKTNLPSSRIRNVLVSMSQHRFINPQNLTLSQVPPEFARERQKLLYALELAQLVSSPEERMILANSDQQYSIEEVQDAARFVDQKMWSKMLELEGSSDTLEEYNKKSRKKPTILGYAFRVIEHKKNVQRLLKPGETWQHQPLINLYDNAPQPTTHQMGEQQLAPPRQQQYPPDMNDQTHHVTAHREQQQQVV